MKIFLNGNELILNTNATLQDLIDSQGLSGKRLAAEVNLEIIPKANHPGFILNEQDRVEIVHAIGGG
jgi:sulfur carrier protein